MSPNPKIAPKWLVPQAQQPILILGAGLTGSLVALALMRSRPEVPFLLIEQGPACGGGPMSPFFLDSVPLASGALIDPLIVRRWADHYVATAAFSNLTPGRIAYAIPEQLHAEIVETLPADRYALTVKVAQVRGSTILLADGTLIQGLAVLDARGGADGSAVAGTAPAWRHMVSRQIGFERPHGLDSPILIDSNFEASEWDFLQYFPLDPFTLLLQYVAFSGAGGGLPEAAMAADLEGGRLLAENRVSEPLRPVQSEGQGDGVVPIHSARAAIWDPVLPARVAGAVRIAAAIAAAPDLRAESLKLRIAELERRAAQHLERRGTLIDRLCSADGAVRQASLLSLCSEKDRPG